MIGDLMVSVAILLFAWMTAAFVIASLKKRLDVVDSAWGIGFILAAWFSYAWQPNGRSLLIAILVSLWGVRLAWHTYRRGLRRGRDDPRYDKLSKKWGEKFGVRAYLSIFLLQGALIWVISLPIMLAVADRLPGAPWFMWLGTLWWLKGFAAEAIADWQLSRFISRPKNKGHVLQTGIWRYSRHPNYYGEIVQWLGIGLIACAASFGWLGFIGPLTLAFTIIFISGIPPIENAKKADPEYQAYKKRTSPLIPWFPKGA